MKNNKIIFVSKHPLLIMSMRYVSPITADHARCSHDYNKRLARAQPTINVKLMVLELLILFWKKVMIRNWKFLMQPVFHNEQDLKSLSKICHRALMRNIILFRKPFSRDKTENLGLCIIDTGLVVVTTVYANRIH